MRFTHLSLLPIAASTLLAAPAWAEIDLPSGQDLALYDLILDGDVARFRFLAPAIAGEDALGYGEVAQDFAHLCAAYALPALTANEVEARQVVITLSDREVPFGQAMPDAVQMFEAFVVENGTCVWEPL